MIWIILGIGAWLCYQAYLKAGGGAAGEQAANRLSTQLVWLVWLGILGLLVLGAYHNAPRRP